MEYAYFIMLAMSKPASFQHSLMPYACLMNIVFDFGNVLVEWNPARLIREHFSLAIANTSPPDELAAALINHQDWLDFDLGWIGSAELAERSSRRLGLDADALHGFIERIPHVLPVFDETVALMTALAQRTHGEHRVLYLSNMPASYADLLEVRCPWIAQFEDGIFSGRVNLAKPDDAIYALAEQQLRLNPAETLFLDDSAKNVAAARERGWQAEVIVDPHNTKSVSNALIRHGVLATA
jgi:putative hydrolase of the HAD superfamily